MPTPAYPALAETTLTSDSTSLTFSNIPTTDGDGNSLADLVLTYSGVLSNTLRVRLNNVSSSSYNQIAMYSYTGSTVTGGANTFDFHYGTWIGPDSSVPSTIELNIMDFADTSVKKHILGSFGSGTRTEIHTTRADITAAISSIEIYCVAGVFSAGSQISLHGVVK